MERKHKEILGLVSIALFIVIMAFAYSGSTLDEEQARYDRLVVENAQLEAKLEYLPQLNAEILKRHETLTAKESALVATEKAALEAQQRLSALQAEGKALEDTLANIAKFEALALAVSTVKVQEDSSSIYWGDKVNITRTVYPALEIIIYSHPLGQNIVAFSELSEENLANVTGCHAGGLPCVNMTALHLGNSNGIDYDWDAGLAIFWTGRNNQSTEVRHFRDFDSAAAMRLAETAKNLQAKAATTQR